MRKQTAANKVIIVLLILIIIISLSVSALFIFAAYGNFKVDFIQEFVNITNTDNKNNTDKKDYKCLLSETETADISYLEDAVFVGDSRTNAMYMYGYITQEQNFSEDGLNHGDALTKAYIDLGNGGANYTLRDALRLKAPHIVYLSFGINSIGWLTNEEFMSDYQQLIDLVKEECPSSDIVITSILPVADFYEVNNPSVTNEKIDEYNDQLLDMAEDNRIYFLDMAGALKNSENDLISSYHVGDGIHMNQSAYEVIVDEILSHPVAE